MGTTLQEADKKKTGPEGVRRKSKDGAWDTIKVVIQALLIAFVIRTFFFQPFNIPSGSMIPTLLVGDYLFVNKLSYGYGPYSFNFGVNLFGHDLFKFGPLPFTGRHVLAAMPERGDVVVFKLPIDNETDYIKRVIGLPGDRIQMRQGQLYINGTAVPRERIEDSFEPSDTGVRFPVHQFRETLPNGVTYTTFDLSEHSSGDNTAEFLVPPGRLFMMGDNRDNSTDSRFDVGYVPVENLIGRATILFFSHRPDVRWWEIWRWPFAIRWSRFFHPVD
jgi:signal peptidase I